MKKFLLLFLTIGLLQLSKTNAQPIAEKNTDGFNAGKLIFPDNSTLAGSIKDHIRKKGELILLRDGKKTKFKANDITGAEVDGKTYISDNNVFYELIWQGKSLSLLRKASVSSGIQFNGTEPIVTGNREGVIDDLFLKKNNDTRFHLVSKKSLKEVLEKICGNCTAEADPTLTDTDYIKKAIAACDTCK